MVFSPEDQTKSIYWFITTRSVTPAQIFGMLLIENLLHDLQLDDIEEAYGIGSVHPMTLIQVKKMLNVFMKHSSKAQINLFEP